MSKVKISKAIHNAAIQQALGPWAVVNMSKVKISKAIHNAQRLQRFEGVAVVNMSKVKISKAIHNRPEPPGRYVRLLSICQR